MQVSVLEMHVFHISSIRLMDKAPDVAMLEDCLLTVMAWIPVATSLASLVPGTFQFAPLANSVTICICMVQ